MCLWNDLADPAFDGVGLAGFESKANAFLLSLAALSLLQSSTYFPILFFLSTGLYWGAWVFGLIGCISLSLSLALLTSFNNNNKKYQTKFIVENDNITYLIFTMALSHIQYKLINHGLGLFCIKKMP